jgi:hypothetical protein
VVTLVRFLTSALLTASLVFVANGSAAATIDVLFGDIDGFGFSDVSTLVDGSGGPADKNSNGILDEHDTLPDLALNGGVDPAADDVFDNRQGGDPSITDSGFTANSVLSLGFAFAIPLGHIVTGAQFSVLAGDLSRANQALHTISIDGQPTGETLVPRLGSLDGEITLTEITVDSSLLGEFADGTVSVGLAFNAPGNDDIAIDYAQLSITTQPIPEPSTLTLLGLGLCALAWRRRRV